MAESRLDVGRKAKQRGVEKQHLAASDTEPWQMTLRQKVRTVLLVLELHCCSAVAPVLTLALASASCNSHALKGANVR